MKITLPRWIFLEEFCHLWTTSKGTTLKKRKTKKRTQRKGTNKINQKSSTIFTSTN